MKWQSLSRYYGTRLSASQFTSHSGTIWLDDVDCFGNEDNLLDCPSSPVGSHNCGHYEDVALLCKLGVYLYLCTLVCLSFCTRCIC